LIVILGQNDVDADTHYFILPRYVHFTNTLPPQISETEVVMDVLIQALRARLGGILFAIGE